MKFKLDENIPVIAAEVIHDAGYEVCTVAQQGLSGIGDDELLARLQDEQRVLVTLDLDFSNIKSYPPSSHSGIIVLRPVSQDVHSIVAILKRFLPYLQTESVKNRLWVVDAHRIRIRE